MKSNTQENVAIVSGATLIAQHRAEQVFRNGYTVATDQKYYSRDVFQRAAIAILHQNAKEWPNDIPERIFRHILTKTRVSQVVSAGAFLAAMIDYMNIRNQDETGAIVGVLEQDIHKYMIQPSFSPKSTADDYDTMMREFADNTKEETAADLDMTEEEYAEYKEEHPEYKSTKPPIGLAPRWYVTEYRVKEIMNAVKRYTGIGKGIPGEWISELRSLLYWQHENNRTVDSEAFNFAQLLGDKMPMVIWGKWSLVDNATAPIQESRIAALKQDISIHEATINKLTERIRMYKEQFAAENKHALDKQQIGEIVTKLYDTWVEDADDELPDTFAAYLKQEGYLKANIPTPNKRRPEPVAPSLPPPVIIQRGIQKVYDAWIKDKEGCSTLFDYLIKKHKLHNHHAGVVAARMYTTEYLSKYIQDLWDDYDTSSSGKVINFFDYLVDNKYLELAKNKHYANHVAINSWRNRETLVANGNIAQVINGLYQSFTQEEESSASSFAQYLQHHRFIADNVDVDHKEEAIFNKALQDRYLCYFSRTSSAKSTFVEWLVAQGMLVYPE